MHFKFSHRKIQRKLIDVVDRGSGIADSEWRRGIHPGIGHSRSMISRVCGLQLRLDDRKSGKASCHYLGWGMSMQISNAKHSS